MSVEDIARIRALIEAQTDTLKASGSPGGWIKTVLGTLVAVLLAVSGVAMSTIQEVAIHGATITNNSRRIDAAENRDIILGDKMGNIASLLSNNNAVLAQIQKDLERLRR